MVHIWRSSGRRYAQLDTGAHLDTGTLSWTQVRSAGRRYAHLDAGALTWTQVRSAVGGYVEQRFGDCLKIKPFWLEFHKSLITIF